MAYVDDRLYVNHLYGIFLNEYYKLNKTLELENPIQIYALFHKLVYSGYLSKGKIFNTNISDISDDDRLAQYIFTGNGCCRNMSSMLTDILRFQDINATEVVVCLDAEQLVERTKLRKTIDRALGNHMIVYTTKDNNNYFVDPANGVLYEMTNKRTLSNEKRQISCKIKYLMTFLSNYCNNKIDEYRVFKNSIKNTYTTMPFEEQEKLVNSTFQLYKKNKNLFEKFYRENRDLYREASEKILKYTQK